MPEIAVTVLGITGLLALVSLLPPVANRLNLPFSVLLAGAGCALGVVVFFGQDLALTGLLGDFVAALRGFVISLVVGFALSPFTEVGLIACLLLGAIVATTDPVAVVGIFRDLGAPRRLSILVEGESLFNDAAAIALSALLTAMLLGTRNADAVGTTLAFLKNFAGGAIVGYAAARGAFALFGLLRGLRFAEITLTVALAYLAYIV